MRFSVWRGDTMVEWISCGRGFIQADVVKWRQGIWEKRGPYKGKVVRIGDRLKTCTASYRRARTS
jgi:hypothetical protein